REECLVADQGQERGRVQAGARQGGGEPRRRRRIAASGDPVVRGGSRDGTDPGAAARELPRAAGDAGARRLQLRGDRGRARDHRGRGHDAPHARAPGASPAVRRAAQASDRMSCLEFRREKLADPRRLSDGARAHAAGCATCSAFERDFDRAELRIERALATPVPEGLAERILSSIGSQGSWRGWAVAASVVAALGGFLLGNSGETENVYARLAIEHVAMEPESLDSTDSADPRAFLAPVRGFGGTGRRLAGQAAYRAPRPVRRGRR